MNEVSPSDASADSDFRPLADEEDQTIIAWVSRIGDRGIQISEYVSLDCGPRGRLANWIARNQEVAGDGDGLLAIDRAIGGDGSFKGVVRIDIAFQVPFDKADE
jgi:hypothetical protein